MDDNAISNSSSLVLDVEFLGIGKSILIDVLMDEGFEFAPPSRGDSVDHSAPESCPL